MRILVDKETGQEYEATKHDLGGSLLMSLKLITKTKPVDMSVLVGAGIDCIFGGLDDTYTVTCTLRMFKDEGGKPIYRSQLAWYAYCTPRMNYWFAGNNFSSVNKVIGALRAAGFQVVGPIGSNFKIIGLLPNYCWPWEGE